MNDEMMAMERTTMHALRDSAPPAHSGTHRSTPHRRCSCHCARVLGRRTSKGGRAPLWSQALRNITKGESRRDQALRVRSEVLGVQSGGSKEAVRSRRPMRYEADLP